MKNLFFISTLLIASFLSSSYTSSNSISNSNIDLSGNWNLEADGTLDGTAQGNSGCNLIYFYPRKKHDTFGKATYKNCPNPVSRRVTKGHRFDYQTFQSRRGTIVSLIHHNPSTNYYSTWSGHLSQTESATMTIKGVWTDVDGNQGDFLLTSAQ